MFDETKFCCLMIDPLSYQQGLKHLFCNRNRNCTISQVYLDLQCYQHITLQYNQEILVLTPKLLLDYSLVYQIVCYNQCQTMRIGRKLAFGLHQGFKLGKKFLEAIIISKAPKWTNVGSFLHTQHYIFLHFQNKRPTLLFSKVTGSDLCEEPIKNQIKFWRTRIISRDFEPFPKN